MARVDFPSLVLLLGLELRRKALYEYTV